MTTNSTESTQQAIAHLKTIKPLDGWSAEWSVARSSGSSNSTASSSLVRLLRRNVPLTDHYFMDLHFDRLGSQAVVGIMTRQGQAQVLVDHNGKVATDPVRLITVSSWKPSSSASSARVASSSTTTSAASRSNSSNNNNNAPLLTPEQNMELLKYGAMAILGLTLLKVIVRQTATLAFLLLPIGYVYLLSTCPPLESFDAKKELKRVLRGHHLPADHPDKPTGFWSETLARVQAAVTTELATALTGYEVSSVCIAGGAAWWVSVRVPAAKLDAYWIGAAHRWTYVYSSEYDGSHETTEGGGGGAAAPLFRTSSSSPTRRRPTNAHVR